MCSSDLTIPILLMYNFSLYLIAADKSTLSLICTVAGGVTNIILDYALISLFDLGIQGAAIATGLGYSITAVVGFLVFRKKDSLLHLAKPVFRGGVLFHASTTVCRSWRPPWCLALPPCCSTWRC